MQPKNPAAILLLNGDKKYPQKVLKLASFLLCYCIIVNTNQ